MGNGLIHIYCGDGKGKTTAAVGLAARAWGRGKRVLFVQFLKSEDSGEREALRALNGLILTECPQRIKFTFAMSPEEMRQCRADSAKLLEGAFHRAEQEKCDLLILDELFGALSAGAVEKKQALSLLKAKPDGLEVALTGRDPDPEFLELADYVSEICKRKHPFDREIPAREGIEY